MKFLFPFKTLLILGAGFSSLVTSSLMANSCAKTDIDYYLQRGFTHDQIVRLCSTTSAPMPKPSANVHTRPTPSSPQYQTQNSRGLPVQRQASGSSSNNDQVYFETVLKATSANLTPSSLSYISKECVEYGEADLAGLKDKVCANTMVTLPFNGLQVLKATKGVFLIKKQELLVKGNIQREYLNLNSYSAKKQREIRTQLPASPHQLDLPVRKGIDPKQVAAKLNLYIK